MFTTEYPANDQRTYEWEVEVHNLNTGTKRTVKVWADNEVNAMQRAMGEDPIWMVGITTSTLRDYYLSKNDYLVKTPQRIL